MNALIRFGPFAPIVLAPVLIRLPAWLLGVALSPLWVSANLTLRADPAFAPGLPGFMDLEAGWTTQALGTQAALQWLSGRVPWWDPFSGVGLPLAAEMQSSALFLPYILLLALPGGAVLLAMALQVTGGAAALALLRRLGIGRLAAVTGALLFELGGSFAWIGAPCGLPIAFLPLFLLGLERARSAASVRRPQGYRTIALAVALSLYAGFPETAYLDGLMALAWAAYRAATLPAGSRLSFLGRVAAGGAAGLALAAPVLVPFGHLLTSGELGERAGIDMGGISLPEPGDALYLLPYLLGPIAGYSAWEPTGTLVALWGKVGGYLGFPLALAALLGLLGARRHERGLRLLLGGWILACLVRSAAIPGAKHLWDPVPFLSQVQFFRYSGGTWMLAACVLAAFALDDLRHRASPRSWVWAATAAFAAAAGLAAWAGRGMIAVLLTAAPGYPRFFYGSLVWGAATALLGILLLAPGRRTRPALAAALLLLDAGVLFAVPLFSGPRRPQLDAGSISFLQQHLGLGRFYTLGPFQPNYAGMFGIASINHNYLPVPGWWPDYVQARLDPAAHPVLFMGNFPPDRPDQPTHADALRTNLAAFAELGVRYVLSGPEASSLDAAVAASHTDGPATALVLAGGASLRTTIPAGLAHPGRLAALGLNLGTYRGAASGTLTVQVCTASCATGTLQAQDAADGAETVVDLRPPLPIAEGQTIQVTIAHAPGHDLVVWLWPNPGRTLQAEQKLHDLAPALALHYEAAAGLCPAHRSPAMSIYEVAAPSPYFEADPGCTVAASGREQATLDCARPASLLRRELWYPGWRAWVDGAEQPVHRRGPLFQAVELPAGRSQVTFAYRPPFFAGFMAVFAAGLLALLPFRGMRAWVAAARHRVVRHGAR